MNEKLEALNQEIEKTEKKLQRAQHEEKMLEHQIKTLTRKERTHRLCTRAAMLESYLPHPEAITDEQVSLFLKLLFHNGLRGMVSVLSGDEFFWGHVPCVGEFFHVGGEPFDRFVVSCGDVAGAFA